MFINGQTGLTSDSLSEAFCDHMVEKTLDAAYDNNIEGKDDVFLLGEWDFDQSFCAV